MLWQSARNLLKCMARRKNTINRTISIKSSSTWIEYTFLFLSIWIFIAWNRSCRLFLYCICVRFRMRSAPNWWTLNTRTNETKKKQYKIDDQNKFIEVCWEFRERERVCCWSFYAYIDRNRCGCVVCAIASAHIAYSLLCWFNWSFLFCSTNWFDRCETE